MYLLLSFTLIMGYLHLFLLKLSVNKEVKETLQLYISQVTNIKIMIKKRVHTV